MMQLAGKRIIKSPLNPLMIEGKLPPQAIDLEEVVLGAIMMEKEALNNVIDILKPESFYKDTHSMIYAAIHRLYIRHEPADMLTVIQELKKSGELETAGGAYFISQLTSRIGSAANAEFHARIIAQKYIQRELIRISTETINGAYEESSDVFDLLDAIEKGITSISMNSAVGKFNSMSTLFDKIKEKNDIILHKKGLSGVPSGYPHLDAITGGWQSPDLIILAARPAMGKTALAANIARNAAVEFNMPGIIFSLEMSALQIATRIFALESNETIIQFTRRGIDKEKMIFIEKDCKKLINAPLWIDDTAGISIAEMRSKARKMKRDKNIKWMIVDYLQLMAGVKGNNNQQNREQEIASISRGLKGLAKELEIPVIALSQLSRAVESRGGNKRPQLSDLRESGAIEQDADIVIFLHRPEYYGIKQNEQGGSTEGLAEVIFSKNRNGPIGTEMLRFIDRLTKFESIEDNDYGPNTPAMQPSRDFTEPLKSFDDKDLPF